MVDMAHFAGLVAAGLHPSPGAARARRHLDHAQDARRPARRGHPDQRRGARQEDQLRGLPRPAGRPARARHRRQGRGVQDRRRARVQGAPGAHPARRQDPRRAARCSRTSREAGIDVLTGGTDVHLVLVDLRDSELDGKQAEDRLHESASRSTATPCRSTRARRWSPPACASARRRWPPAASATTSSPRSPTSSPRAAPGTDDDRPRPRPARPGRRARRRASRSTPSLPEDT